MVKTVIDNMLKAERNHKRRYEILEKFIQAKFPETKHPSYTRVLDYEKMEWFNSILEQLWVINNLINHANFYRAHIIWTWTI